MRVGAGDFLFAKFGGNDVLGERVGAFEAGASGGDDVAPAEQHFEPLLHVGPPPPRPGAAVCVVLDFAGGDGAGGGQLVAQPLQHGLVVAHPFVALGVAFAQRVHFPAPQRPGFERNEGSFVRPVFDVPAGVARCRCAKCQRIERCLVVVAKARKDGLVMAAFEDIDGVELQQPDAVKQQVQLSRCRGASCTRGAAPEALRSEQYSARLRCREGIDHASTLPSGGDIHSLSQRAALPEQVCLRRSSFVYRDDSSRGIRFRTVN